MSATEALLIVNADDYGYSRGVSRGILDAAQNGIVTATGIMANSLHFEEVARWLRAVPALDTGVHLTLTSGRPLTDGMARLLTEGNGRLTDGVIQVAGAVLSGRIGLDTVAAEWEAQIGRCLDAGIAVRFLNSHEHLHILPPLFRLTHRLAAKYHIPQVRFPRGEWVGWPGPGSLIRNLILKGLGWLNQGRAGKTAPVLLGVQQSGRLALPYLTRILRSLTPGRIYELMCHPGHGDPAEISDPRILAYHHWEVELECLKSEAARNLCAARGIRLIGFRDLAVTERDLARTAREIQL